MVAEGHPIGPQAGWACMIAPTRMYLCLGTPGMGTGRFLTECSQRTRRHMANAQAAWGIEIGAYAIKAVRLERTGDSVEVSDFAHPA